MVRCCTFALSAAAVLGALLTSEAGRLTAEYKIRNLAGPGVIGPLTQACPGEVGDCAADPACLLCVQQINQDKLTADAVVGQTCEGALAAIQAALTPLVPGTCDVTAVGTALNALAVCGVDALDPAAPCGTAPGAVAETDVPTAAPTAAPTSAPTAMPTAPAA